MKFDTIIIGGGLSGLTCGIALARAGQRVAIASGGQSTLHFYSGSMELLGSDGKGNEVTHPLEAIDALAPEHPYRKIGADRAAQLAAQAKSLLADTGIKTVGEAACNHYRLTPMGVTKPAWLTLERLVTTDHADRLPWKQVAVVNLAGFIDFPIDFMLDGLTRLGCDARVMDVSLPALRKARRSATEMRATSLAKVFANSQSVWQLATSINEAFPSGVEAVLMPAVMGIENDDVCDKLKAQVQKPLHFLATLPPAVTGVRLGAALRHYFQMLGGRYLLGDTASQAVLDGDSVTELKTTKLQAIPLQAEHYVLATGSFMSRGLESNLDRIYEPLLDLDVNAPEQREQWSHYGVMGDQPYMSVGVLTDEHFHPLKQGTPLRNVYAVGQLLAGHNPLVMGDGTGVSMLTALAVAETIISEKRHSE